MDGDEACECVPWGGGVLVTLNIKAKSGREYGIGIAQRYLHILSTGLITFMMFLIQCTEKTSNFHVKKGQNKYAKEFLPLQLKLKHASRQHSVCSRV